MKISPKLKVFDEGIKYKKKYLLNRFCSELFRVYGLKFTFFVLFNNL